MSLSQRGNSWQAYVAKGGKRYRKLFPTRSEAEAWEEEAKAALNAGKVPKGCIASGPQSLRELADITYKTYWANAKAGENSYANAYRVVEHLGENTNLKDITTDSVDALIEAFKKQGKSGGTINRHLAALSKMLTHAKSRGWIRDKPVITRQREGQNRVRFITEAEEISLLQWFRETEQEDMAEVVIVLVDTGIRCGELLKLERRDIDLDVPSLSAWDTKNGSARTVPLTSRVVEVLKQRLRGMPLKHDQRIFDHITQTRINHQWMQAKLALGLAGDKQFVPHCLRHTFCSRLVQNGVELLVVKELAGHKTIQTTLKYAHLNTHRLTLAIRGLESRSGSAGLG